MSFINSTKSSSKVCTEIPVSFEASDSASGQWKVTLFVNNLFPFKVWKNLNLNRWISVSLLPYLNCLWLTIDLSIWSEQNVNNASSVHSTLCLSLLSFSVFCWKCFKKCWIKPGEGELEQQMGESWRGACWWWQQWQYWQCGVELVTNLRWFYNHREYLYKDLLLVVTFI